MSEALKETFEHETARLEHEKRLSAGEMAHQTAETSASQQPETKPVTAVEALKNVADANSEDDSQKILERLEAAEDQPQTMTSAGISRAQKSVTKRRELKQLRRQESVPERTLSHVIHQPVIRALSEGAGRSITRPSGLLGGGLVAFLGSGSYFILAKYLGFTYNYSVSLALFIGGFVFGLILELLVHALTASRRQVD